MLNIYIYVFVYIYIYSDLGYMNTLISFGWLIRTSQFPRSSVSSQAELVTTRHPLSVSAMFRTTDGTRGPSVRVV